MCVLYGLYLADVFHLYGMHHLYVVPEVVQVINGLILPRIAPAEGVRLRGVGLRLLVLLLGCGQLVMRCQAALLRGVQRQVRVRVREARGR